MRSILHLDIPGTINSMIRFVLPHPGSDLFPGCIVLCQLPLATYRTSWQHFFLFLIAFRPNFVISFALLWSLLLLLILILILLIIIIIVVTQIRGPIRSPPPPPSPLRAVGTLHFYGEKKSFRPFFRLNYSSRYYS